MNPRLYIGNLSSGVTEADLRHLFSKAGTVVEVQLMLDPASHQSRGFAFVTMATPESAALALSSFHSCTLGERHITVTEARPPQEPKGQMSEGFGNGSSSGPFRPSTRRDKPRRHSRGHKR